MADAQKRLRAVVADEEEQTQEHERELEPSTCAGCLQRDRKLKRVVREMQREIDRRDAALRRESHHFETPMRTLGSPREIEPGVSGASGIGVGAVRRSR